ncbi:hydroxyacylglutathione hydrolase [Gymnodinialimonas hymeniacidonis]|uniref:hydroxyacylglutathione hydrolase n=1 Tax=Gymnodinialimonas hymeniacidonis TaxID=3126508 RepID=UPI0034C5ED0C
MSEPQIVTIPCLSDNYAFLLHDPDTGATACIDVPDHAPIIAELDARGWTLSHILITHHHWDHVQGVDALKAAKGGAVCGCGADAARLPALDHKLAEGDSFQIGGLTADVLDVSGHCDNHLAFIVPAANAAFTADSLMALGCGRLFEGTPDQMWDSLSKLAALPPETMIYSGHEYTASNARFAITIEPDNPDLISRIAEIDAARTADRPTVPSTLALELATNPFLRATNPDIATALGLADAAPARVFAEIRARKDAF